MTKYKVAKVDVHIMDVVFEEEASAVADADGDDAEENGSEEQ